MIAQGYSDDERFRKSERLRKRPQFLRVQRRGRRSEGKWVVVYVIDNDVGHPRLGVTVSRRVGNAVRRNAWKRGIREVFRRNKGCFGKSHDVVVIVKSRGELPPLEDLYLDICRTNEKARQKLDRRGAKS